MHRILHIAPSNVAGVPYEYHRMHLRAGDYSRLVTLHNIEPNFQEDICLNIPLFNFSVIKKRRKRFVARREEIYKTNNTAPFYFPRSNAERLYFYLNDLLRKPLINTAVRIHQLEQFDIIHYDGGLDMYRYPSLAMKWKKNGKKIVCCYYGSDLRIRGIIKELDEISDLNITSEYDHLALKPDLHYLFYPYDTSEVPQKTERIDKPIRIVHSPTNRLYKGTELILGVIANIQKVRNIDFVLLEGVPRRKVLEEKADSDIVIDQVGGKMGGTGYGRSGLETLSMGIPVITNMTAEYEKWLPENPFCVANSAEQLYEILIWLIDSPDKRSELGTAGKSWVEKYHGYSSVNRQLFELYKLKGIV